MASDIQKPLFFVSLTCESSSRCVNIVGSFWGVPISGPPSDLLKSWGGGGVTGMCTVPGQEWSFGAVYIVLLV